MKSFSQLEIQYVGKNQGVWFLVLEIKDFKLLRILCLTLLSHQEIDKDYLCACVSNLIMNIEASARINSTLLTKKTAYPNCLKQSRGERL